MFGSALAYTGCTLNSFRRMLLTFQIVYERKHRTKLLITKCKSLLDAKYSEDFNKQSSRYCCSRKSKHINHRFLISASNICREMINFVLKYEYY